MTPTLLEPLPIAYLPGASGRASVWHAVASRLSRRRPPIFCDYPGLTDAPAVSHIGSLSELTSAVVATLPARVDVVSLSAGAAVALRLALEHPSRVRRLVLVTPAAGVDVQALGGLDWRDSFLSRRPDAPRWFVDDRTDLSDRLHAVSAPVLIVVGDADLIAPVAVGRHLLDKLPAAKLEVVASATHDLEAEQPDLLASAIEAHLRK